MEAAAASPWTGQEPESASGSSSQQLSLFHQLLASHRYLEKTRIDTTLERGTYIRERSRLKQAMDSMLQPLRDLADDNKPVTDCIRDVRLKSNTVRENIKAVSSAEERIDEMEDKLTKEEHRVSKLQRELFGNLSYDASQPFHDFAFNIPDNLASDTGILDTASDMTASVGRTPSMRQAATNQKKRPWEGDELLVEELEIEIYELNRMIEEVKGLIKMKDGANEYDHADLEQELADVGLILGQKKVNLVEIRAQKQARVASWVQQQETPLLTPTPLIDIKEILGEAGPADDNIMAAVRSASSADKPSQYYDEGSPSGVEVAGGTHEGLNSVVRSKHKANTSTQESTTGTKCHKHLVGKSKDSQCGMAWICPSSKVAEE